MKNLNEDILAGPKRKFEESCKNYSFEHKILPIEENLLKHCFKMPEEGVRTKHAFSNIVDVQYPVIRTSCFDLTVGALLGKYWDNREVTIFTYYNGDTFITKSPDVQKALEDAGYTRFSMFVPFSQSEIILDENYAEELKKIGI